MRATTDPHWPLAGPAVGRAALLLALGAAVGGAAGLAAGLFVEAVVAFNRLFLLSGYARLSSGLTDLPLLLLTLAVPVVGGATVAWLVRRADPRGRPTGPADVIRAVQLGQPMPGARSGAVSTLAAALSLGVGASVGQYGPMVVLGAFVGNGVRRLRLGLPGIEAIAIACGVSAAIAGAFGAPLAGLVFAHEVVLRHFALRAFAPVTVAAIAGDVVGRFLFVRTPVLPLSGTAVGHPAEYALFALLGLVAAGASLLYMTALLIGARRGAALPMPPALRGAAAGLVVGMAFLTFPEITGLGPLTLRLATIEGAFAPGELAVLLFGKLALTALCLGMGFVGGVFSPALIVGCATGGLFWTCVAALSGSAPASFAAYVVAGMVAVTTPVVGAPLAGILIVLELTRSYDMAIASMVAIVVSNGVTTRVFGRSLFDRQLQLAGIDLSRGRARARLDALPVAELIAAGAPVCPATTPQADLAAMLARGGWSEGFLTDDAGRYVGRVRAAAVDHSSRTDAAALADREGLRFDVTTSVGAAMERLGNFVGDAVPVVERDSGCLVGVVTEAAVIRAYLRIEDDIEKEDHARL